MSNYVTNNNNTVTQYPDGQVTVSGSIPAGVYDLKFFQGEPVGLTLRHRTFQMPPKVYGELPETAGRILTTYTSRTVSTGVLAHGRKGSGKSLLAKMLSNLMYVRGLATIIVPYSQIEQSVVDFIEKIDSECMVLFDEIDKGADVDVKLLLSILDGVGTGKKLFVLTANDSDRLDDNFHNRPGRIYYSLFFTGLSEAAIDEYIEDKLDNKDYADTIKKVSAYVDNFTYDMLAAICEECNRYKEAPEEVLGMLNILPEVSGHFSIRAFKDGVEWTVQDGYKVCHMALFSGTPCERFVYVIPPDGSKDAVTCLTFYTDTYKLATREKAVFEVDGFTVEATRLQDTWMPWSALKDAAEKEPEHAEDKHAD